VVNCRAEQAAEAIDDEMSVNFNLDVNLSLAKSPQRDTLRATPKERRLAKQSAKKRQRLLKAQKENIGNVAEPNQVL
jgi:hypothetical protein